MSVSIINTPNIKPTRYKHVRNTNKIPQTHIGVDDILNKYVKYKTDRGGFKDKINELDNLEFSISQLPFMKNTKMDLINRNIYDIVSSSINRHEFNNLHLTSNYSFYSGSEYNDLNNLLLQASFWGYLDDITRFLDMGANVNYCDQVGRSPIHYSTALGSVECVKQLISRGADVNATDLKSWSSLHIAVTKNYTNVAKILIDAGADVKALLKHKCAPSRIVDVYSICIHFASIKGNIEMTNLLVENGLSVNDRDSVNLTPVDYAAFRKNYRYLKYILDNGGRIDNTDINNRTVLHSAALGGHVDNFKLLLSKGGNPRLRDNWGLTPYDLAVLRNHEKLIKFMEKTKCNITGIDGIGGSMGPSITDKCVANAIAIALQEPKVDSIAMMVKCLGSDLCLKLLEAALAVDRRGGMMTMDGKRKRSKGGIFFFLLKELYNSGHVSKDDYAYIKMLDKESKPKTSNTSSKDSIKFNIPQKSGTLNKKINVNNNNVSIRPDIVPINKKITTDKFVRDRYTMQNVLDDKNKLKKSLLLNKDDLNSTKSLLTNKDNNTKSLLLNKDDLNNTKSLLTNKDNNTKSLLLNKDNLINPKSYYLEDDDTDLQSNGQLNHKLQLLMLLQKFQQQLNVNIPIPDDNNLKSSSTDVDSANKIMLGNTKGGRKGR